MKVVLLAGGLGTRMREESEYRPKPMVRVGGKPVLWHIMKIFSSQGYNDFVICAGYKGEQIKQYFYNYSAENMDFTVNLGDENSLQFYGTHEEANWNVTVVDTGINTLTAERILRVREHLGNEPFFCTYGDGIADVNLGKLLELHQQSGVISTLTATRPTSRFGMVEVNSKSVVTKFEEKPILDSLVNIGYFIFEPTIFDYLGDFPLEDKPLSDLTRQNQLAAHVHSGFWHPMDTQRELEDLNKIWNSGNVPWKIW